MAKQQISCPDELEQGIHKKELSTIAKGATVTFIGMMAESLIRYIYMIVIARMLGAELFGLFMLGFTIIIMANLLSRLGLECGVTKHVSLFNGVSDRPRMKGAIVQSLKFSILAGIIVSLVFFFASGFISIHIFKKPQMEQLLKLLIISLPFLSFTIIVLAATRGFQIMKYWTCGMSIFLPMVNLLLVVLFVHLGFRIKGVALAYLIATFMTSILSVIFLRKVFPDFWDIKAIPETRMLLRFSIPLLIVLYFNFIIKWTDTLMLGGFKLSEDVGIYNGAMRTALLTSMILMSFSAIFSPMIADLYNRKESQKIENLFKITSKWIYTVSLSSFILLVFLAKEILAMFGQEFIAGWIVLVVLSMGQLVAAAAGPVGVVLTMTGRQDFMMYNTVGVCIFNIILNLILIPLYGIIGAAVASCTSIVIFNIIMLVEVYFFLRIHPFSLKYAKPTLFSILSLSIVLFIEKTLWDLQGLGKILVYGPMFMLLFGLIIYLTGLDDEDKLLFSAVKRKFLKVPVYESQT